MPCQSLIFIIQTDGLWWTAWSCTPVHIGPDYDRCTILLCNQICCLEEEHLCFARKEEKWIIYGSKAVEAWDLNYFFFTSLFFLVILMTFGCICSLQIRGSVYSIGIGIGVSGPKYFSSTVLDQIAGSIDSCRFSYFLIWLVVAFTWIGAQLICGNGHLYILV